MSDTMFALTAFPFKRCKTRTVSTKNRAKLTVCRANKQERHILCLRCTEWLWNTAVNEHVNSRDETRNLGDTELRGRHMILVAQGIHLSPVSTFICKTMSFKFAVRADNPYSHCYVCHLTLPKQKVLGIRCWLFLVELKTSNCCYNQRYKSGLNRVFLVQTLTTPQHDWTSQCATENVFVFERSEFRISTWKQTNLTNNCRGFPQPLQVNTRMLP
jgi:hypothetical protein